MRYLQFAARRSLPAVLAAAVACALTSWISIGAARAGPAAPDGPSPAPYLGRWNYDQPDRASMRNIAVIQCPVTSTNCSGPGPAGGPLQIPQIGDIVFTQTAGGVVGHTDQGCTWQFAARPGSLELARPSENCFNQVIGSSYTITRWSVTVHGNHEQETITAVSHLPAGDYDFVLANGSRTRTPEKGRPAAVRQFLGPWEYTPADPQTLVNIVTSQATGPDGVHVRQSHQQGMVNFTRQRGDRVFAQTADGCRWTLTVRGNTAQLAPAPQACHLAGSTVILMHWTIASDGTHQASVMSGVQERDASTSSFLLNVGDLARLLSDRAGNFPSKLSRPTQSEQPGAGQVKEDDHIGVYGAG